MPSTRPRRTVAEVRAQGAARAAQVIEDAEFLASTGVAAYDAAPRLGFADDRALDKYLRRWNRPDVVRALTANNRPGIPTGRVQHHRRTQEARAS